MTIAPSTKMYRVILTDKEVLSIIQAKEVLSNLLTLMEENDCEYVRDKNTERYTLYEKVEEVVERLEDFSTIYQIETEAYGD